MGKTIRYVVGKADDVTDDGKRDSDMLFYRGKTWSVESEPVVIDSDGEADLVEVWVRRGEGIEQPE